MNTTRQIQWMPRIVGLSISLFFGFSAAQVFGATCPTLDVNTAKAILEGVISNVDANCVLAANVAYYGNSSADAAKYGTVDTASYYGQQAGVGLAVKTAWLQATNPLSHCAQDARKSIYPQPFITASGQCDWSCYTQGQSPAQALQTEKQYCYDYNYRAAGAAKNRPEDNAVDVWGWDPYTTMQARQQYSYCWVPNAYQPNIPIAPKLTEQDANGNNLVIPYNCANAPAGSIPVTLQSSGPCTCPS